MTVARQPERRQLTVMLCDLVGWTALAEQLDAEELVELVRAYRQRCTGIIARHGGTVAQYVGDAILAYFGYPNASEDDAERAIRAALLIAASERAAARAGGSDVHIGIATGTVVVGSLHGDAARGTDGSVDAQARADISAVGSALNLAARLQSVAGPGMVVVSDQTRRLSRGIFEYRDLGRHLLKGFDEPVQAWEATRERLVRSRFHALQASALTPLVNRKSELEALARLWTSVRSGQGKAVLLTSEPGMGKSRLADEVARRIVDDASLRVWYHCSPHLQGSPLAPLVRHVTLAADLADKDDDESKLDKLVAFLGVKGDEAHEVVPLIASLLSIPYETRFPPLVMSTQRRKHQLFEALVERLVRACARGPVLLVVEDLHWMDPSTEELLGLIVERLRALPILALLTARPEFRLHWGDSEHVIRMPLPPLDRKDAVTMIEALCGDRAVAPQTIAGIAERADGLPLFIEDLTRDVLETAPRPAESGALAAARAPRAIAIPATLTDALMSRLDRLGAAKGAAQIGAVIGREFAYDLLARVAGLPEAQLKEQLNRLVEAGLLTSRHSMAALLYAFKHALVRDAAYASLLKKEQSALHAHVARVLQEDFPETAQAQPEVVAHHFEAAGEIENAVPCLIDAARLAATRSGFVEAVDQLHHALELLATRPRTRERVRLELRIHRTLGGIHAEHRGFSSTKCGKGYAAALELCRELGDTPEIFSVLSGLGAYEITRANFATCRALADECLSRAAGQQSEAAFVMGHLLLGGTLFLTAEFQAAREHLGEALRLYEATATPKRGRQVLFVQDQRSTGLSYLALTLASQGDTEGGLRAALDGLAHSESLGGLHTINYSLCYLAAVHHFRRDGAEVLRRANESLELSSDQGFATWVGISQMIRGEALAGQGEIERGLADLEAGMRAHRATEAVTYQPFGFSLVAKGLLAAGRLDDALDAVGIGLSLAERTGERFYLVEVLRLKGEILARRGSTAEAEHWVREAIARSREQGARLFELRSAVTLCRILDEAQRDVALRNVLEPIARWFEGREQTTDVREARALLAENAHRAYRGKVDAR